MRQRCMECERRTRCLAGIIMEHLQWVTAISFDELSGCLTVEHEYPDGVNVSAYLRELFKKGRWGEPVEMKLVRHEPGETEGRRCSLSR